MGLNRDFQAVLMAGGKGSRMTDLSSSKLKCLLPVGNFPMLYYPLSLLQKIGCKDVIVIVPEVAKSEVIAMPKKYGLDLCLDVVTISQQEDDCGTADSLRRVHDKITAQTVFVLSSDLFTDLRVHQLVDLHRVHQSSVTALFAKNSINMKAIPVPGPKAKVKRERDIIGIDHQKIGGGGQICYWSSDADLDEDITIKRPVLQEHPNFKVYSNLTDAHFYIFEKWVVDFIVHDDSFSGIKGEVMPYLVKKQFSRLNTINVRKVTEPEETPNPKAVQAKPGGLESFLKVDEMGEQARNLSSWNDHIGDMKGAYRNRALRCYAYVMDGGTCLRANTMQAYCELNRQIANLLPTLSHNQLGVLIHPNANVQPKAQVGFECLVGENTLIAEKTTIKNCVIGANCKIDEKVRLTNCIIMDNVTISALNNLTGSIICEGTDTCTNIELKDCIVSRGHHFSEGEKRSNELLGGEEGNMMEI